MQATPKPHIRGNAHSTTSTVHTFSALCVALSPLCRCFIVLFPICQILLGDTAYQRVICNGNKGHLR